MTEQVAETGHRPEGVGVSRDMVRTKSLIYPAKGGTPITRHCGVFHHTPHSTGFRDAVYLNLFDQPVKLSFITNG